MSKLVCVPSGVAKLIRIGYSVSDATKMYRLKYSVSDAKQIHRLESDAKKNGLYSNDSVDTLFDLHKKYINQYMVGMNGTLDQIFTQFYCTGYTLGNFSNYILYLSDGN